MEHNSYYDGLSDAELYQDSWLIVAAELLWYCESRHVDYIRYNQLKVRSNEVLNVVTKGERPDFGGSFDSIMNSHRYERFWHISRTMKHAYSRISQKSKTRLDTGSSKILTRRISGL